MRMRVRISIPTGLTVNHWPRSINEEPPADRLRLPGGRCAGKVRCASPVRCTALAEWDLSASA